MEQHQKQKQRNQKNDVFEGLSKNLKAKIDEHQLSCLTSKTISGVADSRIKLYDAMLALVKEAGNDEMMRSLVKTFGREINH